MLVFLAVAYLFSIYTHTAVQRKIDLNVHPITTRKIDREIIYGKWVFSNS